MKLLNTIDFRKNTSNKCWDDMLNRMNKFPSIFQDDMLIMQGWTWKQLKSKCSSLPKLELLDFINKFWNTKKYKSDLTNSKKQDYWETPFEFTRKCGDCEDYAIIKYFTLKEFGFDINNMRILLMKNNQEDHAVLLVNCDDNYYILDNQSDKLILASDYTKYKPVTSLNEKNNWIHIPTIEKA